MPNTNDRVLTFDHTEFVVVWIPMFLRPPTFPVAQNASPPVGLDAPAGPRHLGTAPCLV